MRHCGTCNSPRRTETCFKCGSVTFEPHPSWENLQTPDVDLIRELAREVGYAIGEHGSKERDLDLIAVPWTAEAVGPNDLIDHVCLGIKARCVHSTLKPHGRLAVSIQIDGWFKLIDLSICPMGNGDA